MARRHSRKVEASLSFRFCCELTPEQQPFAKSSPRAHLLPRVRVFLTRAVGIIEAGSVCAEGSEREHVLHRELELLIPVS